MWQKTQLEKLGVEVRYQTELTKAIVEEEKPDTVVVATGSHPFVPPFPGKDQEFVVSAVDLLRGKIQADGNIHTGTIPQVCAAGASILTGGTSGLFRQDADLQENLRRMKEAAS